MLASLNDRTHRNVITNIFGSDVGNALPLCKLIGHQRSLFESDRATGGNQAFLSARCDCEAPNTGEAQPECARYVDGIQSSPRPHAWTGGSV